MILVHKLVYILRHQFPLECALTDCIPKPMVWLQYLLSLASAVLFRDAADTVKPQPITSLGSLGSLSSPQIDAFAPFSYFSGAAYCDPSATSAWTCGCAFAHCLTLEARPEEVLLKPCFYTAYCRANPDFKPFATGGDGSDIQFCTRTYYD